MPIDSAELSRRLEAADRARAALRRTTLEWRALGRQILERRERGPLGSDDGDARRR